nr:G499 [uncultured bacterium]
MSTGRFDAATGDVPAADQLVQRAADLVPMLIEQQAACEAAGRVSDETVDAFARAGFFRILQPARWGGYEMSPLVFYRVLQQLGRGCPSSAWVTMVIGVHQWEFASLDPKAAQDVWGQDNTVLTSSSYAALPTGTARRTEGGYLLNGFWQFSSGCDHCRWAFVGGLVEGTGGSGQPPEYRVFLVPRGDYEIDSASWDVFGLRGTGSKNLVMQKDVFVPQYRTHVPLAQVESEVAHRRPRNYRTPFGPTFSLALASAVAGIARGAYEAFLEQMRPRKAAFSGAAATLSPFVQQRTAQADAKIRGAVQRIDAAFHALDAYAQRAEPIPLELRAQTVWDAGFAGQECQEAVMTLFRGAGARAVFNAHRLQRHLRDILAGTNHITMQTDALGWNAGALQLGYENMSPLL